MGGSKGGSSVNVPKPPPLDRSYGQGVNLNLQYLPAQLQAENAFRSGNDASRIQAQQNLQSQFGNTQYAQQRQALSQVDPGYLNAYNTLGNAAVSGVEAGTQLTPGEDTQLQQEVRGAQAARGNIYGDAPAISEAYTLGDRGMQLYQQRLQNLQGYLGSPTPGQQMGFISPVSPDRSFSYVDPSAGFQGINAANARYQGIVGAAAANQGQNSGNSWLSTLGDVAKIAGTVAMFA